MKLFNLFKKQEAKSITRELISLSSLANVPTKDYFKDNNQILLLINLYKKEYLEILIKEKVLTSKELKSDKLQNKLKMIHNLIEQNTLADELFEKVYFTEEDKVKALIKLRKFAIYNEIIKELEEEIICRIIALKEILKKTFLNKQKRISIINEVNNLTFTFVSLMNQKETLKLCLNNYGLKCFDITKETNHEKEEELIKIRIKELNEYQKQLFSKIAYQLNNLNDMAKVEVALEEYVYANAWKINQEISKLNFSNFKTIDAIEDIENKLYLFYEFGKKIIKEDILNELYKAKFHIFTNGEIGTIKPFIRHREIKVKELEVYKNIIMQKISNLLKGNNLNLSKTFNDDTAKAIQEVADILKSEKGYNAEEILNSRYMLNLLLATEIDNGVSLFFANYKINKTNYPDLQTYSNIFDWEEKIPLETLYRLENMQKMKWATSLYNLYVKNNEDNKYYYLYKGIKSTKYPIVETFKNSSNNDSMDILLKTLKKEATGKIIIMPNSLKEYEYNLFENMNIKGIIFPEGMLELESYILANNTLTYVSLPSSISTINGYKFKFNYELETLVFENSRNSNILWDKNLLCNLLKGFIDTIAVKGEFYYIFKNTIRIKQIILIDGDKQFEISKDELECSYSYYFTNCDATILKIQELAKIKLNSKIEKSLN